MSSEASESGFTLIELVVVIVIIGILAAAALPRFVDLTGEARQAAVEGVASSIDGSATMLRSKWMAQGASSGNDSLKVGGNSVSVNDSGYPTFDNDGEVIALLKRDLTKDGWKVNSSTTSKLLVESAEEWAVDYNPNTGVARAISDFTP